MLEAAPAVGSHDQQVGGQGEGFVPNHPPGISLDDPGLDGNAFIQERRHELGQLPPGLLAEGCGGADRSREIRQPRARGGDEGDHVQHLDPSVEPVAQGHRALHGAGGELREVHRAEDPLQLDSGWIHGPPPGARYCKPNAESRRGARHGFRPSRSLERSGKSCAGRSAPRKVFGGGG